jgi:hypothetical protein
MKRLAILTAILAASMVGTSFADEHAKDSGAQKHEHEEHGEEGKHARDEGDSQVGPEKGILEASESEGIKLSPEATKNFELETQSLSGQGPWSVPASARLLAGEEVNLFRVRNGFYKRVDFFLKSKTEERLIVTSRDLRAGDFVVTKGIGFLRISEITAFGGAPEGHSH